MILRFLPGLLWRRTISTNRPSSLSKCCLSCLTKAILRDRHLFWVHLPTGPTAMATTQKTAIDEQPSHKFSGQSHPICRQQYHAKTGVAFETCLGKNAGQYRNTMLAMAIQLSDKDFSDATEAVLTDHLVQTNKSGAQKKVADKELFNRYVLSPRIALENLSPWRSFLNESFGAEIVQSSQNDVSVLTSWIRENIRIDNTRIPRRSKDLQYR